MKSFQTLYEALQRYSRDSGTTQLAHFKSDMNSTQRLVLASFSWPFLEKTQDLTTTASTQAYELPATIRNNQVISVQYRVSSSTIYRPKPVHNPDFWEYLQSLAVSASDVCRYYYIYDEKIYLWPTPATSSLTIRIRARKIVKDMTAADYTTGTIVTWANADEDITGANTVWTSAMTGRYIRVTSDGYWYEILSRSAATAIKTVKNFEGTSIAAGSEVYTIGEMPVIPSEFHDLLLWRPLAIYFMEDDMNRSDRYWMMYDGGYEMGRAKEVGGLLKQMMEVYSGTQEGFYIDELQQTEPTLQDLSFKNYSYNEGGTW